MKLYSKLFGIPKYNYTLAEDYSYKLKYIKAVNFNVDFGSISMWTSNTSVNYVLRIKNQYAWDGCSGYVWQGETIERKDWMPIVTPNSDRYTNTLAASLIHDFLYQYINEIAKAMGISKSKARKLIDKEFYEILKVCEFSLALVYYYGVRLLGRYTNSYMNWVHA